MQGMGYGQIVPQWQPDLADEFLAVSSEEATKFRQMLSKNEGLYVGFSAAANVCASIKLLESGKIPEDSNVVTILCDTGLKY